MVEINQHIIVVLSYIVALIGFQLTIKNLFYFLIKSNEFFNH